MVKAADSMVEAVFISVVEDVGSKSSSSIPSVLTFTEPAVRLNNLSMPVVDREEGGRGKELSKHTKEEVQEGGGKGGQAGTQGGGRGRGQHEREKRGR